MRVWQVVRVDESDISGAPIEPHAAATVVAVFDDGTRRRLMVTSAEAAHLQRRGTDTSTGVHRARALLTANGKRFAFWALPLFVASLAIPAATRQLADRQQATALKTEIIGEISRGSATAFAEAKNILEVNPTDLSERRLNARSEWEVVQGHADALYAVYFDKKDPARRAWNRYRDAVYAYLSTICCIGSQTEM